LCSLESVSDSADEQHFMYTATCHLSLTGQIDLRK
jgi:hypothetical protein